MINKKQLENIPQKYVQDREVLMDVLPLEIPFNISIEASNICNFKCVMCEQSLTTGLESNNKQNMPMENFDKAITDIKVWCTELGKKVKTIRLYAMGEPLLHPQIGEMVRKIKEADICMFLEITTNGSLLTEEIARQFVAYGLDYIRFSIYSIYEDKNEKITQSKSKPEDIRNKIAYLRSYRDKMEQCKPFIQAKLIDTYSTENEDFLKYYAGIADETFIDQPMDAFTDNDVFENLYDDRAEQVRENVHSGRIYQQSKVCRYPFTHMTVMSNGDVCVCCNDFFHKTVYGNLMKCSLKKLWQSKALYDIRIMQLDTKGAENEACRKCDVPNRDCEEDCIDGWPKDKLSYSCE